PADHPGADAAENDAALPRLSHRAIHAVQPPDCEQVRGVSAADVDHILLEQMFDRIARIATKERQIRGARRMLFEREIKPPDVVARVAAGSRHKANAWRAFAGEIEDVSIQPRIPRLHPPTAASEDDDVTFGLW